MNIPSRVNPFGYDNTVPPGYIRVEFLESIGRQYISFPELQTGEDFGIDYTFLYTSGQTYALDLITGGSTHYRVDVRSYTLPSAIIGVSWGNYSNTKWVNIGDGSESCRVVANYKNDKRLLISGLKTYEGTLNTPDVVKKGVYLFAVTYCTDEGVGYLGYFVKIKIKHFAASKGQADVVRLVPALDNTGIPCMYDLVSKQPFRNEGAGSFTVGLTSAQALNLANLPATGGSMTVSLPLEAAFDDNVKRALESAAAKGWTITVQYRESELTTKNIDADFLESTGAQWIDTEIVPTNETGLSLTAIPTAAIDLIPFGSRTTNTTDSRFYAVRPRRLLSDSNQTVVASGYGWGKWYLLGTNSGSIKKEETYLNWFNSRKASCPSGEAELESLRFEPKFSMYLFAANISNTASLGYIGRIWNAAVSVGTQLKANFVPALDSKGIPCMYDTVSGQNFYNANTAEGAIPFTVGFDTTEKAAISLSKLPATTGGTLTVSLPAEAADEATRVPDAIDIATNRGWKINPQYRTN